MKLTTAKTWLVLASFALISMSPGMAQDSTTTTTTTDISTAAPAATTTVTTKSKHLKKQKAKKAKKVRYKKHHVSGTNLSGGVSRKKRWSKKYKPTSSSQQKRTDKLNEALSSPKQYKKIPELSSPGGVNSTPSAPGL
jgi:hypothetical protein